MRTDLTVRGPDGSERDVAVIAPAGTCFAAVTEQLTALSPQAHPQWSGRLRLEAGSVIGRGPLAAGARLTPDRDGRGAPGRRLAIVGGRGAGRSVPLAQAPVTVGRDGGCELAVPDPRVSRRHAEFVATRGGVAVRDLDSTNGTWADGVRCETPATLTAESIVRVGDSFVALSDPREASAPVRDGPDGARLVGRSPRHHDPHTVTIAMPTPPREMTDRPRMHWLATLLPAIAAVAIAWTMNSIEFLAFAALTPIALLAGTYGDRVHWRRARRRSAAGYRRDLASAERFVADALDDEIRQRRRRDPDPPALWCIATTPTRRLWERPRAAGLLRARIGLGTLPSRTRISTQDGDAAAGSVRTVPVIIDLADGAVGVVGPGPTRDGLARWVLAQLAVLCSPADVEIVVLAADDTSWRWTRWLPHVRRVAVTEVDRAALIVTLVEIGQARRTRMPSTAGAWPGSWLVLLLDATTSADAGLVALLADATAVGITAVCLGDVVDHVPAARAHVISAASDPVATTRTGADVDLVPDSVDASWADALARALTPLRDPLAGLLGDAGAALPDECRLTDLLDVDLDSVAAVQARWRGGDGRPSTVLGVGADGPVRIDLARDGPHVLVAGTTGAGKSELVQTLVAGLAIEHPPSQLGFLLVDYKGGAAFADCAGLPHVAGLVTDLDEHLTRRVLASLNSEIRRRETLLAEAGANDLASYRDGGGRLARLVIVVDEFATLVEELPQFVTGLVGVAQRGRSLGLHLVLATQRPAGVVSAEIRANTALRICLRVTSAADSSDVIDCADAAAIHRNTPGRAYLRVGASTTAFQTARIAATGAADDDEIRVVPLDPWRRELHPSPDVPAETDLTRMVRTARRAADGEPAPHRPWLPPLPEVLNAEELPSAASPDVVIGLIDVPAQQRRDLLGFDLERGGTVLIVGSSRSGRTTALNAVARAASAQRPPSALEIHALDAAGGPLVQLAGLPHVGTIASTRDGLELPARLVSRLHAEFARRRGDDRPRPPLVVLLDGWEALAAASDDYDGGRTTALALGLLADAAAARATVVVTGGRGALAPRVAAHAATRLILHLHDVGDYAAAGVDPKAVPSAATPGHGVRASDGAEFQIALPARASPRWDGAQSRAFQLRALPPDVALADVDTPAGRVCLGVGGEDAAPLNVDLAAGAGRLLVTGPPRAGRSTSLCALLGQLAARGLVVAAPRRSPLALGARERGLPVLGPDDPAPELVDAAVLLADDAEAFADTAVGDALTDWLRADRLGRCAVVAARCDTAAVAFRGLVAEVRHARCGIVLRPGPVDGELFGVQFPRTRSAAIPGRGILVPDPAWQLGVAPLAIQLARP